VQREFNWHGPVIQPAFRDRFQPIASPRPADGGGKRGIERVTLDVYRNRTRGAIDHGGLCMWQETDHAVLCFARRDGASIESPLRELKPRGVRRGGVVVATPVVLV